MVCHNSPYGFVDKINSGKHVGSKIILNAIKKNKPKRLDRNTKWRVARRKKKMPLLVNGNSRNRKPRPKEKGFVETQEKKRLN